MQNLLEDIILDIIPENEDSGEESDSIDDEIENFSVDKVDNKTIDFCCLVATQTYIVIFFLHLTFPHFRSPQ